MIYFIQDTIQKHIKIGYTGSNDASARLATLQTSNANPLALLGTIPGSAHDEADLHRKFNAWRVSGEWFSAAPGLLRFIQDCTLHGCNPYTCTMATISVRVLTLGRQQFSLSLLKQLPRVNLADLVDWGRFVHEVSHSGDSSEAYDLTRFLAGAAWGWVKADQRFLIAQQDTLLVKALYPTDLFPRFLDIPPWQGFKLILDVERDRNSGRPTCNQGDYQAANIVRCVELAIAVTPGFRKQDQLFFGM